jgi:lipoprotein NlpI
VINSAESSARRAARIAIVAAVTLCAAVSAARSDDRGTCGASPPKPETVAACTRIIASPATSAHDRALAYAYRGDAARARGDMTSAAADYDQSLLLLPNLPPVLNGRGIALRNLHKYDAALADFNHAIELTPGNAERLRISTRPSSSRRITRSPSTIAATPIAI